MDSIPPKNAQKSNTLPKTRNTRLMTSEERVITVLRASLAGIYEEIEHGLVIEPERLRFLEDGLRDLEEKDARSKNRSGAPLSVRQHTDNDTCTD